MSVVATKSIESQLNVNKTQEPGYTLFAPSRNNAPYKYNQNGRMQEPTVLSSVPTMHNSLTTNPLPAAPAVDTFNDVNLNPRSMLNYAQPSYGQSRMQKGIVTDPGMNRTGKPLVMTNAIDFKNKQFDNTIQFAPYRRL